MGGAMSASVPPLSVRVEEEVGGANSRQGSETCRRRVMLLNRCNEERQSQPIE